ncbi:hypothetical protein O971_24535 [Mycobacterium avium subsp. hominissuis 10-4249]|nr:hypothetical protein O971_24535 [Mycobacterium avium subsp. hominissuis 10-4249]KDO93476.1 hypothetical protein MAVA5_19455 [Mycobacterium avium subsp. hominissuis A5]
MAETVAETGCVRAQTRRTGHNLSIHDAKLWPESDR